VLFKRDWRRVPRRRQRVLAILTLCTPFLQAVNGLLVPVALSTMLLASLPIGLTMLSFLPLVPAATIAVVEHLALDEFGRTYQQPARWIDHVRLFVGAPFFHVVLSWAAARAVLRQLLGHRAWEKTTHLGLHIDVDAGSARHALSLREEAVGA
jgi:hypothetical protein